MLFSSREVADQINATFEPAWESVRPVPLVTMDFGNGHTVKRTLQGNIATYICVPDGTVYDVLPGIYTADVYRRELGALAALAESLRLLPGDVCSVRLRDYHARQAAALQVSKPTPQMKAVAMTGGGGKGGFGGGGGGAGGFGGGGLGGGGQGGFGGIEGPTQRVIMGQTPATIPAVAPSAGPLAARPELVLDAQVNELIRRRQIHERLAGAGVVRPDDIKKWLFKEVLHADLDDPLLGLGGVLNANYPFAEEDRAAGR